MTRCCRGKHNRQYQTDLAAIKTNMAVLSQNPESVLVGDYNMDCYAIALPGFGILSHLLSRSHNHMKKPNQDRVLVHYDEDTRSLIVGVFDGHGKDGHLVAHVTCNVELIVMYSLFEISFYTVCFQLTFSRLMLYPLFILQSRKQRRKLFKVRINRGYMEL